MDQATTNAATGTKHAKQPRQGGGQPGFRYGVELLAAFLLIGGAAVTVYTNTMSSLGWGGARGGGITVPVALGKATKEKQVLLLVNDATARYLAGVGGNYEAILKPWRNFFMQEKIPFKEITRLDAVRAPAASVLVLPSVIALSDADRKRLLAYRDAGGSVLVTSTLGARDASGAWRGYDWLKEFLGVTITGEIPREREERHLNLFGDLPFVQSYGVAERIWLGMQGANPLRLQGGRAAGSITDWARSGGGTNAVAVAFDELGPDQHYARWVMLGFSEMTWEFQRNASHRLLANAITWLQRTPVIYPATWPSPYRAAQIIEMDTEEGFTNATHFSAMMDKINATATFYLLTEVARQHPNTVRTLAKRHELGYHGDTHVSFAGQSEDVQSKRIATMQAHMREVLGDISKLTGFRAPTEGYDKTTEELLLKAGIRHHAADPNRANARTPLFFPNTKGMQEQALVVLPRTQMDDINILPAAVEAKAIASMLKSDFDGVRQMGALGLLSVHSQNFALFSPLSAAFPEFLDHLRAYRHDVWLAPAGEVANWWRERERLTYKVSKSANKLAIDVSISGSQPAAALSLIVNHPRGGTALQVRPEKSNTPLPAVRDIDGLRSAMVFENMRPGTYSYALTFPATEVE